MPAMRSLRHPARLLPLAFLAAVLLGTGLLLLPVSRTGQGAASFLTALFTATSSVCVTGLAVVETSTYWSPFGQAVILALIQAGGFGIMTLATLLVLVVYRRLGLASQLTAQAETKTLALGEVRGVLGRIALVMAGFETVTALLLAGRYRFEYGHTVGESLWYGVFYAVGSFNNAGLSLLGESMMSHVTDPWICLPVAIASLAGGIGFPVLLELGRRQRRPRRWSIHTKITVVSSVVLTTLGTVAFGAFEWRNPDTLGQLSIPGRLLASFFQTVMQRGAGFNSVDYGAAHSETLLVGDMLMFIGGGSAGTAGGITVTTFSVLGFVIWAEVRGEKDVRAFDRSIGYGAQRQALAVALLGVAVVASGTLALLVLTDAPLDAVLFESTAAFATAGLSTGITGTLNGPAQLVVVMLMFIGRVGPVTVGTALALRSRARSYRLPEERPIVG